MHIFDVLETWLGSMDERARAQGVTLRFQRSPTDGRDNLSCALTLSRGHQEIDFLLWESGDAELTVGTVADHSANHFDGVKHLTDLEQILRAPIEHMLSASTE